MIGTSNTDRIELLLELWVASESLRFAELALELATSPVDGFDSWHDGRSAMKLMGQLEDGGYYPNVPNREALSAALEKSLLASLNRSIPASELPSLFRATDEWQCLLSPTIPRKLEELACDEILNVEEIVGDMHSESDLAEHVDVLPELGARTALPKATIDAAVKTAQERLSTLEERESRSVPTRLTINATLPRPERPFDDAALANLFAPLRVRPSK